MLRNPQEKRLQTIDFQMSDLVGEEVEIGPESLDQIWSKHQATIQFNETNSRASSAYKSGFRRLSDGVSIRSRLKTATSRNSNSEMVRSSMGINSQLNVIF